MYKPNAIVFGAYINPDADWRGLIRAQILDLSRCGVLVISDLYVVATNPKDVPGVYSFFSSLKVEIKSIQVVEDNKFEFPALCCAWDLAQSCHSYSFISYLHTKGMSYAKTRRDEAERIFTTKTFSDWEIVINIFDKNPSVAKIGLLPAAGVDEPGGWIWYNFWWARADYIRGLSKPKFTSDRHYCEGWMARSVSDYGHTAIDCFSLFSGRCQLFSAKQAEDAVKFLKWKKKYGFFFPLKNAISSRPVPKEVIDFYEPNYDTGQDIGVISARKSATFG